MKNNHISDITFGNYLKEKRLKAGFTLRKFAGLLGVSPAYMCDIENNHRTAPEKDKLEKIILLLNLDKNEKQLVFDLAATGKSTEKRDVVSIDIADFIMKYEKPRAFLRKAKEKNLDDKQWEKLIEEIDKF